MAPSGFNGRNESRTGYSYSLDLSFLDQNGNTIVIENIPQPIEMAIPRDSTLPDNVYLYVNTSTFVINSTLQILPNSLTITATNASLHIQLKPSNSSIAYLFLLKFGSTPQLGINSGTDSYDYWTILCPNSSDYVTINDTDTKIMDSFYLIFFNQSRVNGYQGEIIIMRVLIN